MFGLAKKVIIAEQLANWIVKPVFNNPTQYGAVDNLVGAYKYAIQIYADFSGYTDIAIGLALLLGIKFPQNFNSPYIAATLQDFWRRWHMTLSRWLRDYPLHLRRRQPAGGGAHDAEPLPHDVPGRHVARRELDLRDLGAIQGAWMVLERHALAS